MKFIGCSAHQNWIHASWRCDTIQDVDKLIAAYDNHLVNTTEQHDWENHIPVRQWWIASIQFPVSEVFKPRV